ncbi:MAG TPA: carboxypeptidase regulatory-like domain-containing protein [Bryobacteraceae bacterium]|nr:carboxypeptidase regulatory-like domain-containing protein [Bryobacteraceae bacterium]
MSRSHNHVYRTKFRAALSFAAVLMFAAAPHLRAQEVAVAEVDGHVTDPSGASVAGATVKLTEADRQIIHTFVTDASGTFRAPNLPVGPYILEVNAQGFKAYRQTGIILQVASNVEQNVVMQIGSLTETVEVVADASMVETKDSAIGQVMEQRKIVDLPLNGRNLTQLLTLVGGGSTAPGGDLVGSKNIQGSMASGTFSVAGGQANGVNYLLDGGDNNDAFSNVNLPLPFPDAVQEFSVQTNAMQAQYGLHPGGVVNVVTKSGTNAFHGDAFEFLRNYELNARPKGLTLVSGSVSQPVRDSLKRNQFGGTAGGRIKKDKLFFFGGYQQTTQRSNPAQTTAHVPTALTAAGNFSVEDAATSAGGCQAKAITLKDPTTGNPFPGNIIPVSRFDPAGAKLLSSYIPTSTDPCGLVLYGQPANNPDWEVIGRVDYVISDKQSIYGRFINYNYTAQRFFDGKNALTTGPNPGNLDNTVGVTIGDTYTVTPTMVNSFHATFNRRADNRGSAPNLFGPQALGIQNFADNMPDNYMQITVSNYFNVACGTCAPGYFNVNTYQLSDDYQINKGKHQIAFGIDGRKLQFNSLNNQQSNGQWSFTGSTTANTGDSLADLELGKLAGLTDGNALSDYMRQTVFAAYGQDTIRVTSHLTVNLGVRWEPYVPTIDKQCRGNQFLLSEYLAGFHSTQYPAAPAGLLFGHDAPNANGCHFADSHWADFSPRLGIVLDPKGDGKQTIRAAFGMLHDNLELFYPERWTTNPPYASSIALGTNAGPFSNPYLGYVSPTGVPGDPFPGAAIFPGQGTYVTIPPHVPVEYILQWNLSYQRQIGKDWLATATYIGNRSNHIPGQHDINVPQPSPTATTSNEPARRTLTLLNAAQGAFYSAIDETDPGGTATYHALLLKLEHRFANHFTWLANYTQSHCISTVDFGSELAGNSYQNPANRNAEKGDCNFDRRHIFNTSLVAISPGFGTGFARTLSRDWQVAPIITFQSGQPFSVTDGTDVGLTGDGSDRPNVVAGVNSLPRQLNSWFNPAAFAGSCALAAYAANPACQTPGTFGNAGRDIFEGPGSIQWDMSLSRVFRFKETRSVEVRSDFFNFMNHANWNSPSAAVNSATFGQITGFGGPRLIQLSMKVLF